MPASDPREVTFLLRQMDAGDANAANSLLPKVYDDLREIAEGMFRRQNSGHTLQPTALVHEAFLRLVGTTEAQWNDRRHFLCVAATAMRQLLCNHGRDRLALKRGGAAKRISFSGQELESSGGVDLVELNGALEELEKLAARQARIVEMRFLAGMTIEETAESLGVSERTVTLDWKMARSWLRRRLSEPGT